MCENVRLLLHVWDNRSSYTIYLKTMPTHWLTLKYVVVRLLHQWENLSEYFLRFLPGQSNFKRDIKETQQYKWIKEVLKDIPSQSHLAFLAFSGHIFLLGLSCEISVWRVTYSSSVSCNGRTTERSANSICKKKQPLMIMVLMSSWNQSQSCNQSASCSVKQRNIQNIQGNQHWH